MARPPFQLSELSNRAQKTLTWQEAGTSHEAVIAALAAARSAAPEVTNALRLAARVVFTGAGSSYYLARVAAATYMQATGAVGVAAPLSEILLRPTGVLAKATEDHPVVIISRSGETSEAVAVARQVRATGRRAIAVTCRPDSPLAGQADDVLISPKGDEHGIVMTRSFTSMLALLLRLIANVAEDRALSGDVDLVPERWPEAAEAVSTAWEIAGAQPWSRVVVLGGGPAEGIAQEAGLKLTETSQIPVLVSTPLEFRHGPMSVNEPGVLVIGLIDAQASEEVAVLHEARGLGSSTWVIGPVGDLAKAGRSPGVASIRAESPTALRPGGLVWTPIGDGMAAHARLPLLMPPLQALAIGVALVRGRDPDAPRHIGQVVVLPPTVTPSGPAGRVGWAAAGKAHTDDRSHHREA